MSIHVSEFEPQLIFPTQELSEVILLASLFANLATTDKELQVGFLHQIRNSKLSIQVNDDNGESVGLVVERGDGEVRQVRQVDAKTPHFILGESVHYSYGNESGSALTVKAIVSRVKN